VVSTPVDRAGALLEVRGLAKTFTREGVEPLLTLDGVDLSAQPGEFVAVIGPSGCGKSTLFQILAGLETPSAGEVLIDGRRLENRLGVCAFMPQRDGLLPWRRTIDNATIGLELAGVDRAAARERARPLLERFGLGGFETAWPWQLSGGMRHRAAFLRTVLLGKPTMLLDEPFGALDGITRSELQQWLLEVWSEVGSTVALITHDVAEAVFLADRVYVLTPRPGRVAAVIDIDLPRPRTLAIEESPEFGALEARLRELLRASAREGAPLPA
jgi:ABC-type nitrate/sulfonate/bicarbonate transport system ATPase subunit